MSNEREVFERTLTRLLIEQHKPDFERFGFEYMDGDTRTAYKMFQAGAAYQREQNAYRLAVDTGLVCAHIGVTNPEDAYETARKKLNDLICWSIQVDRDLGREHVKGLVEALEDAVADYDAWAKDAEVTPNESVLAWVTKAKQALAAYRAAQEQAK